MSKLQELIDHLCPNGVEFKPLGEIVSIVVAPKKFNKKEYQETGLYPIIDQGKSLIIGFTNDSSSLLPPKEYVLFGEHTRHVKYYNGSFAQGADGLKILLAKEIILPKYLFFAMECLIIEDRGYNRHWTVVSPMLIPIPPLEVQDEIVKILDRFSDYAAELQAELQARRLQYEYYRNLLLTFNPSAYGCGTDDAQKISVIARGGHSYKIQWKTMGEIGKFFGGLTGKSKADFSNGNARFISYMNVYSNIALDQSANEFVSILPDEKQNVLQYGDALFTGSSETPNECGMSSVVTTEPKEPLYLNSFSFGFRLDNISTYHPDFLKHLLRSTAIRDQIAKTANGVTRFNVSKALFAKIILPIPPIELQVKIASILDRFETLVNDLSKGLPAEIEAVKARYEYYRNKLLCFKEKPA